MDLERLKVLAGMRKDKEIGHPYDGIMSYTPPVIRQFNTNNTGDNPMMNEVAEHDLRKLFKKFSKESDQKLEIISKIANASGVKIDDLIALFPDHKPAKTLNEYFEAVQKNK